MRFYTLGTGSGIASAVKNASSFLVEASGYRFILDAGEGCTQTLLRLNYPINEIDAIILTHLHPDHIGGIYLLLQTMYLKGRSKVLNLYLAERVDDFLKAMQMQYLYREKFQYELKLKEISELSKDYPLVKAMANDHLIGYTPIIQRDKLPNQQLAYSIRILGGTADLVYTADVTTMRSIVELLKGADTVIADGLHPEFDELLIFKELDIRRVLLSHETPAEYVQVLEADESAIYEEIKEGVWYTV